MTNKERCKKCIHKVICTYKDYFDNVNHLGERCKHYMAKDLINYQKAEIERLKSMNQSKLDMIHDLREEIENTQQSVGNWILKPEKFVDVSYNNDMSINETIVGDYYLICSECGREFFVYEYIGEDSQKSTNFDTLLKEFPYCTCGTKMKEIKYDGDLYL